MRMGTIVNRTAFLTIMVAFTLASVPSSVAAQELSPAEEAARKAAEEEAARRATELRARRPAEEEESLVAAALEAEAIVRGIRGPEPAVPDSSYHNTHRRSWT